MKQTIWIKSSFAPAMRFVIDVPSKPKKPKVLRRHGTDAPRFLECPSLTTSWHGVVLNARKYYKPGIFISQ